MRMMSIASGSSGNAIYVGSDTTHILVDAGISGKRIEEGLKKLDVDGQYSQPRAGRKLILFCFMK